MALFSKNRNAERIGVLIDIGSGSAMVALTVSDPLKKTPDILWSKRENATLKDITDIHESSKPVLTALVNLLLEFETTGRLALEEYKSGAKIDSIQCTISAPWSYTVTKRINYEQEEPFEISEDLLDELVGAAKIKTEEGLKEHEQVAELGLQMASRTTLQTVVNGYPVKQPIGKITDSLSLMHTSVVVHSYVLEALDDMRKKVFPGVTFNLFSYSLIFNCVAKDLLPGHTNFALVDVTYEATEISIVRDNILTYVTHTPYGLYSLARELSAITGDPTIEMFKHLYSQDWQSYNEGLSKAKQDEIETLFTAYVERIRALLLETGDELAIPRHILLHSDQKVETLFSEFVSSACKKATRISPVVTKASALLSKQFSLSTPETDTAMLVAAAFFHTDDHCITIERL